MIRAPAPLPLTSPVLREAAPPVYEARDLTQGGPSAQIALDGQIYTLRITKAGKLILTK